MPDTYMRGVIGALLPDGAVWKPAWKGYFDRLLDGAGDNSQAVMDDLEKLAYVRNPYKVEAELLPDLEREFGVTANPALTGKDRRESLAAIRYKVNSLATIAKLQRALDKSGFGTGGYGLVVTPNSSPAADPTNITDVSYALTAHDFPSIYCAGNAVAYAGYGGGYYLVNGDHPILRPVYPQAGMICARAFDGSDSQSGKECAGYYDGYMDMAVKYTTPADPKYWSMIFFVGGAVTRNPDGSIASVASVTVPAVRRQELHRLILRIKPVGIWAAMMINFV
jgi:hypothetical protein